MFRDRNRIRIDLIADNKNRHSMRIFLHDSSLSKRSLFFSLTARNKASFIPLSRT